jgi:hypothetical protein
VISATARNQSVVTQLQQDLRKKVGGDGFRFREMLNLRELTRAVTPSKFDHDAGGVINLDGYFHAVGGP